MVLTRDASFYRSLVSIGAPIALQSLVAFLIGLSDNLMAGALGEGAVSGIGMANQMQSLVGIINTGIESSILILAAQALGAKKEGDAGKSFALGVILSFSFGLFASLACFLFPRGILSLLTNSSGAISLGAQYLKISSLSYVFFCISGSLTASMRARRRAMPGFVISLATLLLKLFLNYVLMFGKLGAPGLGAIGAAIATLAARVTEALIGFIYVFFIDKASLLKFKSFLGIRASDFTAFLRHGSKIIAIQLIWSANIIFSSATMGRLGDLSVSAFAITNTLYNLAYVATNGAAGALGIIFAEAVGRGERTKLREYSRSSEIIFLGIGILCCGAIFLLCEPFLSIYSLSPEAHIAARKMIFTLALIMIATCYQSAMLSGIIKSSGDLSFVLRTEAISVFIFIIPLSLLAARLGAPPYLVYAALKSDQLIKSVISRIKLSRFDFIKDLTQS